MVMLFFLLQFMYGNLGSEHLGIKGSAASALQIFDLLLFLWGDFDLLEKHWCKTCVLINLLLFSEMEFTHC